MPNLLLIVSCLCSLSQVNRKHGLITEKLNLANNQPKTRNPAMDSGPRITQLPKTVEYDATEISDYISSVLQLLKQEGAYGIFVGVSDNTGQVVPTGQVFPTFVFGVRQMISPEVVLPQPPHNFHIWVREDHIV